MAGKWAAVIEAQIELAIGGGTGKAQHSKEVCQRV